MAEAKTTDKPDATWVKWLLDTALLAGGIFLAWMLTSWLIRRKSLLASEPEKTSEEAEAE